MAAFHIVCIDLQLWLAVHTAVLGHQDVGILLVCIGLLGIWTHEDFAIEDPFRLIIDDPFIELMGLATRYQMVDDRVVIHQVLSMRHVRSVEMTQAILPFESHMGLVPCPSSRQRDGVLCEYCISPLMHFFRAEMRTLCCAPLQAVQSQFCIVSKQNFGDHIAEDRPIGMEGGTEDMSLSAFIHDHHMPIENRSIRLGIDMDQMDWFIQNGPLRHMKINAPIGESCIQSDHHVILVVCQLAEHRLKMISLQVFSLRHRKELDPLRKLTFFQYDLSIDDPDHIGINGRKVEFFDIEHGCFLGSRPSGFRDTSQWRVLPGFGFLGGGGQFL